LFNIYVDAGPSFNDFQEWNHRAWIAAHNDEVKLLAKFKELVVLLMGVMDQLAAHSRRNHTLRRGHLKVKAGDQRVE
jgi:hypothetical protein